MGVGGCSCCCYSKDYVNDEATIENVKISKFLTPEPIKKSVFNPENENGNIFDDDTDSFDKNFEKLDKFN